MPNTDVRFAPGLLTTVCLRPSARPGRRRFTGLEARSTPSTTRDALGQKRPAPRTTQIRSGPYLLMLLVFAAVFVIVALTLL
jgi:hypothetical protein